MSNTELKDQVLSPEEQEELSEEKLNEQRRIRREKLKKLQEMGRNPFLVEEWDVDAHSMNIKNKIQTFIHKIDEFPIIFYCFNFISSFF